MSDTPHTDAPTGGFDGGPKGRMRSAKAPVHLWPFSATVYGSLGMLDGAVKYGRFNFREEPLRASDLYAAALRHLGLFFEGSDRAPDTSLLHLGSALSSLATLVDAMCSGTLVDDRPPTKIEIEQLLEAAGNDAARLRMKQAVAERAGERQPPTHYAKAGAETGTKFAP